ncbi:MAG: hypothetical protein Q9178_003799 [Gyalolechia marmorata]
MPDTPTPAPPPPTPTNLSISQNGTHTPLLVSSIALLTSNTSKRIFLLGPSHHLYLPTLALPLPSLKSYSTPLGPLPLDTPTLSALRSTHEFSDLPLSADEAEHSLEMHLPYIHHLIAQSSSAKLVPILVGSTSPSTERKYGTLLAPYIADPENIFIISSDFCHWGLRFQYTYYLPSSTSTTSTSDISKGITLHPKTHKSPPTNPPIHESIATVDQACISAIETGSHESFLKVLKETGNTVCGRHPIGVIMAGLEILREKEGKEQKGEKSEDEEGGEGIKGRFKFVRYERSSDVERVGDSSVSYASAFAVL